MKARRIAFVGCGAVVERCHQPALETLGLSPAAFFDPDLCRARLFAERCDALAAADFRQHLDAFDAAIVSVPHALHAPIACDLLSCGKDVFVEKPMATSLGDARAMVAAASTAGAELTVGVYRRFAKLSRWVKGALEAEALGHVRRVSVLDGAVFRWPITTDSLWRKEVSGGGVLIDRGAHALDLLIWWFGTPEVVAFTSDACGGVEADCTAQLTFPGGIEGRLTLSRLRELPGTALIEGDKGRLEVGVLKQTLRTDVRGLARRTFAGVSVDAALRQEAPEMFAEQIRAWVDRNGTGAIDRPDGEAGLRSIEAIAACYARAMPATIPWLRTW